jgi:urea carboxylase-associated protein 1
MQTVPSHYTEATAVFSTVHPAGEPWMHTVRAGQIFRIVDLEGNQAVDTLFYNAADLTERYSATNTIQAQGALYLTVGTQLMSSEGRPMLTIVADTCGRHDTLGGACSCESNTVRYALEKRHMHSCRDNFMLAIARYADANPSPQGVSPVFGKRDVVSNINFFMNVPVTHEGKLTFEDGISAPGKYVEMRAEMDVIVLVSNCPQLNNPCNAYNPTPVRFLVWDGA